MKLAPVPSTAQGMPKVPVLAIPEKLAGIWEPKRYKVMHGGRGGGKSWTVAAVLLVMASSRPLRVLCTREIQKSIKQSVHQLLKDVIARLNLHAFFEVLETEVRGINGSLFLFSGLTGCGFGQFTSVLLILAQNRFRFFQCLHNMVKISI